MMFEFPDWQPIYNLDIRDTAGSEDNRYQIYARPNVFIVLYSITSRATFLELEHIISRESIEGEQFPGIIVGYMANVFVIDLFSNKCDLVTQREVTYSEGLEFAKKYNCPFVEMRYYEKCTE